MVAEPPITIKLILNQIELENIYLKMIEVNFFNYPESYPCATTWGVDPWINYYIHVKYNNTIKKVNWHNNAEIPGNILEGLDEIFIYIYEIIDSKPEYQLIPEPKAGYC